MSHNTFHVALSVKDLPTAIEQYRKILGIEPVKVKPDYAKFEIADPPVILAQSRRRAGDRQSSRHPLPRDKRSPYRAGTHEGARRGRPRTARYNLLLRESGQVLGV